MNARHPNRNVKVAVTVIALGAWCALESSVDAAGLVNELQNELQTNEDFSFIAGPKKEAVLEQLANSGVKSAVIFGADHQRYYVGERPRPGMRVAVMFHQQLMPYEEGRPIDRIVMSSPGLQDMDVYRGSGPTCHVAFVDIPKWATEFKVGFKARLQAKPDAEITYDRSGVGFDLLERDRKLYTGTEIRRDFKTRKTLYPGDPVTLYFAINPHLQGRQVEEVDLLAQSDGMSQPTRTRLERVSVDGDWLNYASHVMPTNDGHWSFWLDVKYAGDPQVQHLPAGHYHAKVASGNDDWQKGPVAKQVPLDFLPRGVSLGKLYVGNRAAGARGAVEGTVPETQQQPLGCIIDLENSGYTTPGDKVKHVVVELADGSQNAIPADKMGRAVQAAIEALEQHPDQAVLVHCHAGIFRSPNITASVVYSLARRYGVPMTWEQAWDRTAKARAAYTCPQERTMTTAASLDLSQLLPPISPDRTQRAPKPSRIARLGATAKRLCVRLRHDASHVTSRWILSSHVTSRCILSSVRHGLSTSRWRQLRPPKP